MICSISGDIPQEPVVSIKSGNVYEKRLIEKYIDTNGREPTTGEPLSITDIVVINKQSVSGGGVGGAKPRTSNATSIPSMLQMFQNEWDALMLETFTLKQQFEQVRQELAHSLYQYDASCRVIARLIKERDQARNALANARIRVDNNSQDSMETDELSEDVKKRITDKTTELTQKRKKRNIPADLPKPQDIEAMAVLMSTNVNNTAGSLTCLDYHPSLPLAATGSDDGLATLYNVDSSKVVATFKGHQKKVNRVLFHPTESVVCSSGVDKTVRVWKQDGTQLHTIKKHSGDVSGLTMHPLGDYVVSASMDSTWAMHNILTGQTLMTVSPDDGNGGYHCAQFHPDGQVIGLGTQDKKICIMTVNTKKCEIVLAEHAKFVNSIAFSENGYHMASSDSNTVKIWDLRRADKSIKTIDVQDGQVGNISWDPSGTYLGIAGSVISIYNHKGKREFDQVKTFSDSIVYTDIKWSSDSKYFITTSDDSTLKMWGNQ